MRLFFAGTSSSSSINVSTSPLSTSPLTAADPFNLSLSLSGGITRPGSFTTTTTANANDYYIDSFQFSIPHLSSSSCFVSPQPDDPSRIPTRFPRVLSPHIVISTSYSRIAVRSPGPPLFLNFLILEFSLYTYVSPSSAFPLLGPATACSGATAGETLSRLSCNLASLIRPSARVLNRLWLHGFCCTVLPMSGEKKNSIIMLDHQTCKRQEHDESSLPRLFLEGRMSNTLLSSRKSNVKSFDPTVRSPTTNPATRFLPPSRPFHHPLFSSPVTISRESIFHLATAS